MYVAKICLNSVPDGPINFILGGWHYDDPSPQQVGHKTVGHGWSNKLHSWKPTRGRPPNEWGAKWLP